ncbi:MAG: hypothetical protein OEY14_13290, partial [Myxococcales bacterium]|nr:hypothetical protein [Myxococcales bacterium]
LGPAEQPAWLRSETLSLGYRGSLDEMWKAPLIATFKRVSAWPIERLRAMAEPDPADALTLDADCPSSLLYSYASPSAWRRFLEEEQMYRAMPTQASRDLLEIHHTDLECAFSGGPHGQTLFSGPPPESSAARPGGTTWLTDLQDRDVIKGPDRELERALATAARHEPDKHLLVMGGCLSLVTGSDIAGSVARCGQAHRLPIVAIDSESDPLHAALDAHLRARIQPLERGAYSIVLFGMPEISGIGALRTILRSMGVEIVGEVLPHLDLEGLARCASASLVVAYPWARFLPGAAGFAERLGIPWIAPSAPFGCEGSRAWLVAIASALGLGERAMEAIAAAEAEHAPALARLRARAFERRMGFVVPDADWRGSLAPQASLGVPLVATLLELGFDVQIEAFSEAKASAEIGLQGRLLVRYFADEETLEARLSEPDVSAWFSNFRADPRICRRGKGQFSHAQFRMGFEGALRSLEELLAIAELPFFSRYRDALDPTRTEHGGASR